MIQGINQGRWDGVEANYEEEEEVNKGGDDTIRHRRSNRVGRLGGRGSGDDGKNDNKFRGNILRIPPLRASIASLFDMTT